MGDYHRIAINVLASAPGTEFCVSDLVRFVGNDGNQTPRAKHAQRIGFLRALKDLIEYRTVILTPARTSGGKASYRWIGEKQYGDNDRARLVAERLSARHK